MPESDVIARAGQDKKEGKAPSTQAGEFVREEIEHVRQGVHGARSEAGYCHRAVESQASRGEVGSSEKGTHIGGRGRAGVSVPQVEKIQAGRLLLQRGHTRLCAPCGGKALVRRREAHFPGRQRSARASEALQRGIKLRKKQPERDAELHLAGRKSNRGHKRLP
jgi:hypothetical protein